MREYKYDHTIHPMNSPQVFKEFCGLIQKSYPDYQQEELLVDVDGSTIQVFHCNEKEIVVYDDYDVGAVFVLSDVDLSQLLSGRKPEAAA